MRSVDWICFLLYIVPTLICEQLLAQSGSAENCPAATALIALVQACAIALSWEISEQGVIRMER